MADEQVTTEDMPEAPPTMALKCGTVLHLVPVNGAPVRAIMDKLGGFRALTDPAWLKENAGPGLDKEVDHLFTYLAGWGVTNTPTPGDVEELAALGLLTNSERLNRANWVRLLICDEDEAGEFIGVSLGVWWRASRGA